MQGNRKVVQQIVKVCEWLQDSIFVLILESNISVPILNNEECAITRVTKSLGLLIDDKLSFKYHAAKFCNKAKRSCDSASRVLGCEWRWAISALVLLCKTIVVPQLLYSSAKWFEENRNHVLRIQKHCIRQLFDIASLLQSTHAKFCWEYF